MEEKKQTPTYLSITKLDKVIDTLRSRNLTQIDAEYFVARDFSKADAYLAISMLRFLGVLNEDGSTHESIKKFQLVGDTGRQAVAEIIKSSYLHLFKTFVDTAPYNVDEKELQNEFLIQYGMSQRTAGPAVKAFLWLCETAGLKESTIKVQERKKRTQPPLPNKEATKNRETRERQNSITFGLAQTEGISLPLSGGIVLWIPMTNAKVAQAVAMGELKKAVDELETFAKKFFVTEPKKDDSSVEE